MTGGGFVRRSGFGLGRLIVSRGYGSDGREPYENTPLACYMGDADAVGAFEGDAADFVFAGVARQAKLAGEASDRAIVQGASIRHAYVSGAPRDVRVLGLAREAGLLSGLASTVRLSSDFQRLATFEGCPVSVALSGSNLGAPELSGRVVRCDRLDA